MLFRDVACFKVMPLQFKLAPQHRTYNDKHGAIRIRPHFEITFKASCHKNSPKLPYLGQVDYGQTTVKQYFAF